MAKRAKVVTASTASAPGKLMLFGEYAVLEGGPAALIAVDRRAHASISSAKRSVVVSKGFLGEPAFFSLRVPAQATSDGAPSVVWDWEAAEHKEQLGLISAIGERLLPGAPVAPLKIELDTQELFAGEKKLGLGSSAALCVALSGALAQYAGVPISLKQCRRLHYSFQGSGSGADVAACYTGGAILYRTDTEPTPLSIPEGLQLAVVWTGHSASTPAMLDQLDSYKASEPQNYRSLIDDLARAAEALTVPNLGLTDWLGEIQNFTAKLGAFAKQTKLPVFCSPHLELAELAQRLGVTYKPVGAGGGDLGLLLSGSVKTLANCCAKIQQQGFTTLQPKIATNGLSLSGS